MIEKLDKHQQISTVGGPKFLYYNTFLQQKTKKDFEDFHLYIVRQIIFQERLPDRTHKKIHKKLEPPFLSDNNVDI